MTKKEFERIEQLGLAALNLLIALGLLDGNLVQLYCFSGRQDDLAKMINAKRDRISNLTPEAVEWLQSVDVMLRKPRE